MKLPVRIIAVVGIICLLGCGEIDRQILEFQNQPVAITSYDKGGIAGERTILPGSELHNVLNDWVKKNTDEWKSSLITFAPEFEIHSDNYKVNIRQDYVVVNYGKKGGRWKQLVRPATGGIWQKAAEEFLRKAN